MLLYFLLYIEYICFIYCLRLIGLLCKERDKFLVFTSTIGFEFSGFVVYL